MCFPRTSTSPDHLTSMAQGRKQSSVWKAFTRVDSGKTQPDATCNYCQKYLKCVQPSRSLGPHVLNCMSIPDDKKLIFLDDIINTGFDRGHKRPSDQDSTAHVCGCSSAAQAPPRFTPAKLNEMQLDFAKFIYSSGVAFRITENRHLRAFVHKVCPEFDFPSRHRVAGDLLSKVYDEQKALVLEEIKSQQYVTMVTDGWTNPNHESVVNFVLGSPTMRSVFWSSITTGGAQHTSEYMCNETMKVIDRVHTDLDDCKVTAVLTDNCRVMLKMHDMMEEQSPTLIANGCAPHMLNLLVQDIFRIDYCDRILHDDTALSKFIRNRSALLFKFRQIQVHSQQTAEDDAHGSHAAKQHKWGLKLPVSTRWYTTAGCLQSITTNEGVIRQLFTDAKLLERYSTGQNREKLHEAREIVGSTAFWQGVSFLSELLVPIVDAIAKLESDSCSSSEVYEVFQSLKVKTGLKPRSNTPKQHKKIKKSLHDLVCKRWESIHTSGMGMAFLFDNTKSCKDFDGDDYSAVIQHAVEYAKRANLLCGLTERDYQQLVEQFAGDKDSFSETQRTHPPHNFWKYSAKRYMALRPVALRVLSISTSSAASERAWSAFRLTSCILTPVTSSKHQQSRSWFLFTRTWIGTSTTAKTNCCVS